MANPQPVDIKDVFAPAATIGSIDTSNPLSNIISPLINVVFLVTGLYFLYTLVMSGFSYIKGSDDKNKIQNISRNITFSILGIIIIALAYLVTRLVAAIFKFNF